MLTKYLLVLAVLFFACGESEDAPINADGGEVVPAPIPEAPSCLQKQQFWAKRGQTWICAEDAGTPSAPPVTPKPDAGTSPTPTPAPDAGTPPPSTPKPDAGTTPPPPTSKPDAGTTPPPDAGTEPTLDAGTEPVEEAPCTDEGTLAKWTADCAGVGDETGCYWSWQDSCECRTAAYAAILTCAEMTDGKIHWSNDHERTVDNECFQTRRNMPPVGEDTCTPDAG